MTVNVEIAEESICQLLELIRGLARWLNTKSINKYIKLYSRATIC